jgi:hypothetical protein
VSDRVYIVPLPGVGTLELPEDVYRRCLRPVDSVAAVKETAAHLVDAKAIAALFSLKPAAVLRYARDGVIPKTKIGRLCLFDVAAVRAALAR